MDAYYFWKCSASFDGIHREVYPNDPRYHSTASAHLSAQMYGISQPKCRASLSPSVVHLSCKHLNFCKKCCQSVSSAMLNGWKFGGLKQPNPPRRHQGGTKEAPRRHQEGSNDAPRRHQGGTKEAPRRHQGNTKEPPRRHQEGIAQQHHPSQAGTS